MFTPQNIKKLTNVSTISVKKNGVNFELALYPNKLRDYRLKLVTNLNEILHTTEIFKNVSKGELSSKRDLQNCFKNQNNDEIIKFILDNGIEKLSEKTRNYELENKEKEVITIIQRKITDKNDKMLSVNRIKDLFRYNQISIDLRREAKVQANEIIKKILKNSDYKKINIKVEIIGSLGSLEEMYRDFIVDKKFLILETDEFKTFKEECEKNNIMYFICDKEEQESEEIC
ncbi:hypothetical protein EDEG_01578 [Edhazardia aedis USNM 41457]|uniref:Ribosome maturation protein SDO1/SBDS N-terminal domain-containing protein n=1 Tax=Edhazardia aedis (strain USNM 41457) TaxID=1003232 RepID=J9DS68_EDHAE|nr:hypothetical protein EDEG_01578 [Edhazardia aedis USNM 41457]|eukprot:EJW04142.1 hypothetical protein EDEG_01578 [Edhazardia aedis USNM 41457]